MGRLPGTRSRLLPRSGWAADRYSCGRLISKGAKGPDSKGTTPFGKGPVPTPRYWSLMLENLGIWSESGHWSLTKGATRFAGAEWYAFLGSGESHAGCERPINAGRSSDNPKLVGPALEVPSCVSCLQDDGMGTSRPCFKYPSACNGFVGWRDLSSHCRRLQNLCSRNVLQCRVNWYLASFPTRGVSANKPVLASNSPNYVRTCLAKWISCYCPDLFFGTLFITHQKVGVGPKWLTAHLLRAIFHREQRCGPATWGAQ